MWTRVYVRELLDRYGGNLSRAARAVSMDRNHLRDLLNKYNHEAAGGGASGQPVGASMLQAKARTS